ncbi:hypothetical protein [Streptomyces sp. NPDC048057]|uniref:hypothetical protein n=1 Tax=Streptomyces sp. NPDC048057 TaxID=3155628 RepID=UPI0033DACCED
MHCDASQNISGWYEARSHIWERLAGATTQTKYHAYTVVESIRLERPRRDYRVRARTPRSS